jgi:hypothetical protein
MDRYDILLKKKPPPPKPKPPRFLGPFEAFNNCTIEVESRTYSGILKDVRRETAQPTYGSVFALRFMYGVRRLFTIVISEAIHNILPNTAIILHYQGVNFSFRPLSINVTENSYVPGYYTEIEGEIFEDLTFGLRQ